MKADVALVAASFLLVYVVELLFKGASYHHYYLALLASTTLVIYLCSIANTKTAFIYAHLQLICGIMYLILLTDFYFIADYLLYSAKINFSLILMAFELAIIVNGAANAISAFFGGLRAFGRLNRFNY